MSPEELELSAQGHRATGGDPEPPEEWFALRLSALAQDAKRVAKERDRAREEAAAWKALAKALMLTTWDTPPGQDAPWRWREDAQEKAKDALRAMGIDPDAPEET